MKQELKIEIEVPDGYKAVYNEETQEVEIKKVELPKYDIKFFPKTWEDFCSTYSVKNEQECFIDENSEICIFSLRHRNSKVGRNLLPNVKIAKAFLALMQLIQLRDCYRQGWTPDWKDEKNKFSIEIIDGEITTYWDNRRSRILSFQSIEVRDEFLNNFRVLIEQAKELI